MVRQDLEDLEIHLSLDEIARMKKETFKLTVKKKLQKFTFSKLLREKQRYRKLDKLHYTTFTMQSYLTNPNINKIQAKKIFKFRIHMHSAFKENFKGNQGENNLMCSLCGNHPDNQKEIESCSILTRNIPDLAKIEEVYGDNVTDDVVRKVEKLLELKAPE